jgi:uncharacterized protein (DUF1330 family)
MTAYINVNFTPLDQEKMQQYGAAVPSTLASFSGKYLVKGRPELLWGESTHSMQVILEFPSKELANAWYHSPEYQALAPLRNAAMSAVFLLVGE